MHLPNLSTIHLNYSTLYKKINMVVAVFRDHPQYVALDTEKIYSKRGARGKEHDLSHERLFLLPLASIKV